MSSFATGSDFYRRLIFGQRADARDGSIPCADHTGATPRSGSIPGSGTAADDARAQSKSEDV